MFESKSGILLIGGLGFFLFAFLSNAVVPILLYSDMPEETVEQLAAENANLLYQFEDLSVRYPEQFAEHFGEPNAENLAAALELGRQVYVGEGCWHCHSQFIRPVSNESARWGKVASSDEYQNELQRPVMWGTRRVGPDLSREAGRRGNDWHAVHFFDPPSISPKSPMPKYPWFYEGLPLPALLRRLEVMSVVSEPAGELLDELKSEYGETAEELQQNATDVWAAVRSKYPDLYAERTLSPDAPNQRGLAVITYVQWLGSWLEEYPMYEDYAPLNQQMQNPME